MVSEPNPVLYRPLLASYHIAHLLVVARYPLCLSELPPPRTVLCVSDFVCDKVNKIDLTPSRDACAVLRQDIAGMYNPLPPGVRILAFRSDFIASTRKNEVVAPDHTVVLAES